MLWLKRTLILLMIIFIAFLAIAFIDANNVVISLNLLILEITTTSGKALVAGFALSLVLVLVATYPLIVSYKLRLRRMQKRVLSSNIDTPALSDSKTES